MADQLSEHGGEVMTPQQIELARHALGLPNARNRSYRNHFVTGEGSTDHPAWLQMVADGNATRRAGNELTGGDDLFRLTRQGADLARRRNEGLCPEDFPKRTVMTTAGRNRGE